MTSALTPLALQNADLLRALDAGGFGTAADLARKMGRDRANFRKTLLALADADLVDMDQSGRFPIPVLKTAGREALAALARAEGAGPAAEAPAGHAFLLHPQIAPDPLNPRKEFDDDAIAELAASILKDGLMQNLTVRAAAPDHFVYLGEDFTEPRPVHRLVAGERRWRAIAKLIAAERWPADRPILCKVVEIDDAAHRRLALVENLQRKDLRPIDQAEGLRALIEVAGVSTAAIAEEIGFTQRFVQQRLQLLELPPVKRAQLQDGQITIEDARRIISAQNQARETAERKKLPKDELLAMAEVFFAARHYPEKLPGWYMGAQPVAVGRRAVEEGDPLGKLVAKGFLSHQPGWRTDARHFVYVSYPFTEKDMEQQLPGLDGKDALRVLRALRCQVLGADEGHRISDTWDTLGGTRGEFATWGLNREFSDVPDPELEAAAEAARQREAKQNAAEFDRNLERRKAEEIAKAEAERGLAMLADVRAFEDLAPGLAHAEFTAAFAELLARCGIAGPYALTWDEEAKDPRLVDGAGAWFAGREAGLEARRRILCIALNYAAGCAAISGEALPTPWSQEPAGAVAEDDEEADEEPDDEPEGEDLPEYLTRLAGGQDPAQAGAQP